MIEFENIVIRTIAEGDIDKLFLWNTCEFRGEFQEFTFESKQSIRKNFEEDGFCTDTFMMLMIEEDSIPVGLVYINFIRFGIARIGLVICSDRRGKGVGSKVSTVITKYLFDNYNIVRIEADTDINNIVAQKILEKSGFIQEGVLRKYRYHHGKYNDSALYSMIREIMVI